MSANAPPAPSPKIIDLLSRAGDEGRTPSVSLEYFPPRTEEGVKVRTAFCPLEGKIVVP
jgi:hypothetical protein